MKYHFNVSTLFLLALLVTVTACDSTTGTDDEEGSDSSILNGLWEEQAADQPSVPWLLSIDFPNAVVYEPSMENCYYNDDSEFRLEALSGDLYTVTEEGDSAPEDTLSFRVENDALIISESGDDAEEYKRSNRSVSSLPRCD